MKNKTLMLGLFCFSASLLMAEIIYARAARVSFGYTYQLLVISLALSGIGFGGLPAFFLLKRKTRDFERLLALTCSVYAVLLPLPFLAVRDIGPEIVFREAPGSPLTWFMLAVFAVYLAGGTLIAAALSFSRENIPVVYSINLAGSAVGAIAVVPLADMLGSELSVVVTFAVAAGAACLYAAAAGFKGYRLAGFAAAAILITGGLILGAPSLRPGGSSNGAVLSTSNSISQVDVYRAGVFGDSPDISSKVVAREKPRTEPYVVVYDRFKKTYGTAFEKLEDADYLVYDLVYFPYLIKPEPDVLIIGSGAGVDVIRARLAGSDNITAVEINPLMVEIAKNTIKTKAYDDESVDLIIGEGRDYVARTDRKFDLVFLPLVGGPSDRGVNSRYDPENYLNTVDAYESYLNRLNKDGMLAVSNRKWLMREYLDIGINALEERGSVVDGCVAFIEGRKSSLAVFKEAGFTDRERKAILDNGTRLGFRVTFPSQGSESAGEAGRVTDDKPFLTGSGALGKIFGSGSETEQSYGGYSESGENEYLALKFMAGVAGFGLAVCLALIVLLLVNRGMKRGGRAASAFGLAVYFTFLGAGYIIFQLATLQQSFLIVGHPAYAAGIVLSSFLLFGGLGSLAVRKLKPVRHKMFAALAAAALVLIILAYAYFAHDIFFATLHLARLTRILLLVSFLAPPSFIGGTLFPIGLRTAASIDSDLIPWMWSINGTAAVLGGAAAALISFLAGFRITLGVAALCYGAAAVVFLLVRQPGPDARV